MVHQNSIKSFYGFDTSERQSEIFDIFSKADKPLTDRDVLTIMGFSDMNCVRPRITELIKRGVLVEVSKVTDPFTFKTVRACKIKKDHQMELPL